MLLVKITNSTEVVASKAGKIFAKMTPEKTDINIVESAVIKQMGKDLAAEGLTGKISIVKGLEVEDDTVVTKKGFLVKETRSFGNDTNNYRRNKEVFKPR